MFNTYEVQDRMNVMIANEQEITSKIKSEQIQVMTQMNSQHNACPSKLNHNIVSIHPKYPSAQFIANRQSPSTPSQNDHFDSKGDPSHKSSRAVTVTRHKLQATKITPNIQWNFQKTPFVQESPKDKLTTSVIHTVGSQTAQKYLGKVKACYPPGSSELEIKPNSVIQTFVGKPFIENRKIILPEQNLSFHTQQSIYIDKKGTPVQCFKSIKDTTESSLEVKIELKRDEPYIHLSKSPSQRTPLPYECLQYVLQDHNYGAPPPRTPSPHLVSPKQHLVTPAPIPPTTSQTFYPVAPSKPNVNIEDDAGSAISSELDREPEPEGEETETAPEGEGDDEDSITRCICDFEHDDGYMICCDRCLVWQHVDCMGIDRNNIPDEYLCEVCQPRRVDRQRARTLQMRKREENLNSDTSSSSSSSSSPKNQTRSITPANDNTPVKGRSVQRRKSEPSQGRRVNNNNNVTKKKKVEKTVRQNYSTRKKEAENKRNLKEKPAAGKKRTLSAGSDDISDDFWGSHDTSLRQLIDKYEEAVTNHYSPELRSRISNLKANGTMCDLRQSTINAYSKCCLHVQSRNLKYLIASTSLPPTSPIIELRGKYMLSTQFKSSYTHGRQHTQKFPGPFVFFYRLPRDGIEVCVDTRTYGNDARFVRRSCKPNAEVKHCIEKGTLHLYIVSTCTIEKNEEITIQHDRCNVTLPPKAPVEVLSCACNNPKTCQTTPAPPGNKKSVNGAISSNSEKGEKRQRNIRSKILEDKEFPVNKEPAPAPAPTPVLKPILRNPVPTEPPPPPPSQNQHKPTSQANAPVPTISSAKDEESKSDMSDSMTSKPSGNEINKKDKRKMTREERKMEAIMKAIERMEKAENRKKEVQARNAQRRESNPHSDNEGPSPPPRLKPKRNVNEKPMRRRKRKGRVRTSSTSQNSYKSIFNSEGSDLSSGDESNSKTFPQSKDKDYVFDKSLCNSYQSSPTRIFGNSSNSNNNNNLMRNQGVSNDTNLLSGFSSDPHVSTMDSLPEQKLSSTPVKSPLCDSGASSSSQSSTPCTPLSSACLLVAAAVGPLAPGFKFPKTKKVLMNEWLKESPEVNSQGSESSGEISNAPNIQEKRFHYSEQSSDMISQAYTEKNCETFAHVSTKVASPIPDTVLSCKQTTSLPISNDPSAPRDSAKKRWLRQAISEECESPNNYQETSNEMIPPPKKRRLARESLSSDNYTPPTTPTGFTIEQSAAIRSSETENDQGDETLAYKTEFHEKGDFQKSYEVAESKGSGITPNVLYSFNNQNRFIKDEKDSDLKLHLKTDDKRDLSFSSVEEYSNSVKREIKDESDFRSDYSIDRSFDDIKSEINEDDDDNKLNIEQINTIKQDFERCFKNIQPCEADNSKVNVYHSEEDTNSNITNHDNDNIPPEIVNDKTENSGKNDKLEEKIFSAQEDCANFDELDFEAQMKKITGDDGNDYDEKNGNQFEREKSEDAIEVLMGSSKEDSDTEEFSEKLETTEESVQKSQVEIPKHDSTGEEVDISKELQEFEDIGPQESQTEEESEYEEEVTQEEEQEEDEVEEEEEEEEEEGREEEENEEEELEQEEEEEEEEAEGEEESINCLPDNSEEMESELSNMPIQETNRDFYSYNSNTDVIEKHQPAKKQLLDNFELVHSFQQMQPTKESFFMDTDNDEARNKMFDSIPPLSERIRKKNEVKLKDMPKLNLGLEGEDTCTEDEKSQILNTAFQELLEAKMDIDIPEKSVEIEKSVIVEDREILVEETVSKTLPEKILVIPEDPIESDPVKQAEEIVSDSPEKPLGLKDKPVVPEVEKRKDPRTAIPKKLSHNQMKACAPSIKRKLSISEYRQRKQQSSCTSQSQESSRDSLDKKSRCKLNGTSSSSSTISSDDEELKTPDIPNPLGTFTDVNNEDRKGVTEEKIGWSAAPTLVERQRENLTERLKREFGLFLNEEEEERNLNQNSNSNLLMSSTQPSSSNAITNNCDTFSQNCIQEMGAYEAANGFQTGQNHVNSGTIISDSLFMCPSQSEIFSPPEGANPYPPQLIEATNNVIDSIPVTLAPSVPVPKPVSPPSRK